MPAGHEDWPDEMEMTVWDNSAQENRTDKMDARRYQLHSWSNTSEVDDG